MSLLARLRWNGEMRDWFRVSFDADTIRWEVQPWMRKPWTQELAWADIEKVAFSTEGPMVSDAVNLFTTVRPESYVVPTEAAGGQEFLAELGRRELLTWETQIAACAAPSGSVTWGP